MTHHGRTGLQRRQDFARADIVKRLLLATDGTVTPMLEQIVGERLVTNRLIQAKTTADEEAARQLVIPTGSAILVRSTDLAGQDSGRVFARTKALIALDVLPARVRNGLLGTAEPIGRLLRENRVETFRESLPDQVCEDDSSDAARRHYAIYINNSPGFLIEEHFLEACFVHGI
ncbi:chorismate--pyruvate lyase family protein [Streptomyces sp. NPDC087901]|uniref:chorismate--pyruvate lyase family protein n=1 Tax=Streptomyces sp. NPDC087901 TaxID=3365818 RepID=UPI00381AD57D